MDPKKRMEKIVSEFQKYVATYSDQFGYRTYSDETFINDMLYGIGVAIEPSKHRFSTGFDLWKEKLQKHLTTG